MKRRRTPLLVTACALAVLSMATASFAQRGGGGGGPGGGGGGGGRGGPGGFGGGPGGGPGGPGGRGGGNNDLGSHLLTLVEDSVVWDEIKITDDQLGKVTRLRSTISKSSREFRRKIQDEQRAQRDAQQQQQAATGVQLDDAARQAARDAARQIERAATSENNSVLQDQTDAQLRKILNKPGKAPQPGQFKRLQEIDLQEAGPLVVSRPDVAKLLNLSPTQIEQVQAIIDGMRQGQDNVDQKRREFFDQMRQNGGFGGPGGGGPGGRGGRGNNNNTNNPTANANTNANANVPPMTDAEREARRLQFTAAMEQMTTDSQSVRDKAVKMVAGVLTRKQKDTFNTLLGKPMDLSLLNDGRGPDNPYNPARRGGGPGGRGGPGGGGPPGAPGTGGTPTVAASSTTTGATGATNTATGTTKGTATKSTGKAQTTKPATKTATAKTGTSK